MICLTSLAPGFRSLAPFSRLIRFLYPASRPSPLRYNLPRAMASQAAARQKSSKEAPYELVYWPGIPGRGEHIRLLLEEAGASYVDIASTGDPAAAAKAVHAHIDPECLGDAHNPPILAPPILRHGNLVLSQTSNILLYLAQRHGLAPSLADDGDALFHLNGLVLTALDGFSDEAHNTHHPIASSLYYEDQKEEAKRNAAEYVKTRLPKFFGYFERVLQAKTSGAGPWLYGGKVTYADIILFQCIDGVKFAFPNALGKLEKSGKYDRVFQLYAAVKDRPRIKEYLASKRRQKYSLGIYRHYPELDAEE